MKRVLIIFIFNLIALLTLYLFASFNQRTFNINLWSTICINYVSILGYLIFIVFLLVEFAFYYDKK